VMGVNVTDSSRTRPSFPAAIAADIAIPRFAEALAPLWISKPLRPQSGAVPGAELRPFDADVSSFPVEGLSDNEADHRATALLDLIATPAAICDSHGMILRRNLLMGCILKMQSGLFILNGFLKCAVGMESTLLLKTIQNLAGPPKGTGDQQRKSQFLRISRSVNAQPLIVVLSPLRAGAADHNLSEVLVRIVGSSHRRDLDVNSLCEVFDLTKSEANLSVALAQCGSLKDAAATCGITTGSARQYMKRIFTKTNTSSQVALLSLLLHYPIL
jgi:DNA-binding CsgD family transcriptional regulator